MEFIALERHDIIKKYYYIMKTNHGIIAIIAKNNKFLLLKDSRELMLDCWGPPHGRCEESDANEEETVKREVFEETNLVIFPERKLWTTKADTKVDTVSFWLTSFISGDVEINIEESADFGWFTIDEALKLKLYPGTREFFNLVKDNSIII